MDDQSIPSDRAEDQENLQITTNKEEDHHKTKPSWHPVYPKSLTKSMKAMISATRTRVEVKTIKQEEDPSEDQELFSKLLSAIQRKEKEEISLYVSDHVSILEKPNEVRNKLVYGLEKTLKILYAERTTSFTFNLRAYS
jgi:hypothetical protein